jgi:hypothetical protein
MLAAVVTALTACASGAAPSSGADASAPPPAPAGALSVVPAALELAPGDTAQLSATVTGGQVLDVSWAVMESGGGSVTTAGLYTAAAAEGTYHVVAVSRFDSSESATAVVTVKQSPVPPPSQNGQGTGATYAPVYLTGVTGGGAMPSWSSNVVTAACAGDGATDDTACLQAAANAAKSQGKALVIPATASFYRITGPITVATSVGGVGGMPTLKQTNTAGGGAQKILILAPGMTGWIWNLHLVGTFNGSNAITESGHNIDVGNVNGVTIKGNLLENAQGDAVSSDISQFDGGTQAQNVLVDGNTMRNPYRCAVGFIWNQRDWVVMNNVIDKQVNYVSGIDVEPESGGSVQGLEIGYNKFVMNNRTPNPNRGADGKAVFGWRTPLVTNPGGDFYIHHNYGTFGTGFSGFENGGWGAISQASNVEGQSVPN